jgi:hypothetical protein
MRNVKIDIASDCHAQRRQTAIDGGHNADKPECLGRTGGRFGHDTISLVEDGFRIQTRRRISSRRSSISQSTRYRVPVGPLKGQNSRSEVGKPIARELTRARSATVQIHIERTL